MATIDIAQETTSQEILTNTKNNNTASKTGTLSQKESYIISQLENSTYGLSAIKNASGGVPIFSTTHIGSTSGTHTTTITGKGVIWLFPLTSFTMTITIDGTSLGSSVSIHSGAPFFLYFKESIAFNLNTSTNTGVRYVAQTV